jgi:hypothetical protein
MAQDDFRHALRLEQVAELREKTEKLSKFLAERLKDHLDTIRPLLAPVRVFGKYIRSAVREDIPGAEAAVRKLCEKYNEICGRPFSLSADLGDNAVADLDGRIQLCPWEYTHEAKSGTETKTITVTSPVKTVLTYKSSCSLSQIRLAIAGKGDRRQEDMREFLIAALAMQSTLDKFPGIVRLLKDLRYDVQVEKSPGLGDLPLVVIGSCVPSFRPADDLVLATCNLSGVPAFIELIDSEAIHQMEDPLKPRIIELLGMDEKSAPPS